MSKIAWIGTGVMGASMASHLAKAGHTVRAYNRSAAKAEALQDVGIIPCHSIKDALQEAEYVFTIVGYPADVEEVYFTPDGILENASAGTIVVDMTTSDPTLAQKIYESAKTKGISALDAPVSGGEPKAIDGTLSFMVGGKQEVFDRFKPVLESMGASVVLCGDVGAGNTTKLANQIVVACNIQAVAEALTLAKMAGVDPELVIPGHPRRSGRLYRHERKGSHDDRRQRQARLQDRPAHQGPEQRSGLRTRCGRSRAHDCRGAGDHAVAPQPRGRSEGPQRHCPVLRVPDRHPDRSLRIKEHR